MTVVHKGRLIFLLHSMTNRILADNREIMTSKEDYLILSSSPSDEDDATV